MKIGLPSTMLFRATHLLGNTLPVCRAREALTRVWYFLRISLLHVLCVSEQVTPLVTASVFSLRNSPQRTEANGGSCPQIRILSSPTSPNASAPPSYFLGEHST